MMIKPSNRHSFRQVRIISLRKGYSLVEMLVVMSASAAVLMLAYTMLVLVMKRTSGGNDQLARTESIGRVSARFRQWVHESASLKLADDGQSLELSDGASGSSASKRLQLAAGPVRLEWVDLKTGSRQIMGLTGMTKGRFRVEKPAAFSRSLVTLELWPSTNRVLGRDQTAAAPVVIQAAQGLDVARPKPDGGIAK